MYFTEWNAGKNLASSVTTAAGLCKYEQAGHNWCRIKHHLTVALGMLAVTGPLLVMKGIPLYTATPSAEAHQVWSVQIYICDN